MEQVLVMARDITDRQQMENQMTQTKKLASLGTLAAGVDQEINKPVGVMLGFTELLLDKLTAKSARCSKPSSARGSMPSTSWKTS